LLYDAFYFAYYVIPEFPQNLPIMLQIIRIIHRKVPVIQ